jgi:hypothetical protein
VARSCPLGTPSDLYLGLDPFLKAAAILAGQSRIYYRAYILWNDGSQNPGQPGPDGAYVTPERGTRVTLGEIRSFAIPGLEPGGICANLDALRLDPQEDPSDRLAIQFIDKKCGTGVVALLNALKPSGAAKIGAILKAGAYPARFLAPSAGTATTVWTAAAAGAGAAATRRPVIVAAGSTKVRKAGKTVIKVRLTTKGKALLRNAKRTGVKLTAKGSFKPKRGKKLSTVAKFTLKR